MLRQETWMEIKALKAQGYSQRAVTAMLGVHRDTVRRAWDEAQPRRYERAPRPSKLDPYQAHLESRLQAYPGLRATRLFREIRELGYAGVYEGVKRWCRSWRRQDRARFRRLHRDRPDRSMAGASTRAVASVRSVLLRRT